MDEKRTDRMRFRTTLRGYDRKQVDAALRAAHEAAGSGSAEVRAEGARALQGSTLTIVLRGYDCSEVNDYIGYLLNECLRSDVERPAAE